MSREGAGLRPGSRRHAQRPHLQAAGVQLSDGLRHVSRQLAHQDLDVHRLPAPREQADDGALPAQRQAAAAGQAGGPRAAARAARLAAAAAGQRTLQAARLLPGPRRRGALRGGCGAAAGRAALLLCCHRQLLGKQAVQRPHPHRRCRVCRLLSRRRLLPQAAPRVLGIHTVQMDGPPLHALFGRRRRQVGWQRACKAQQGGPMQHRAQGMNRQASQSVAAKPLGHATPTWLAGGRRRRWPSASWRPALPPRHRQAGQAWLARWRRRWGCRWRLASCSRQRGRRRWRRRGCLSTCPGQGWRRRRTGSSPGCWQGRGRWSGYPCPCCCCCCRRVLLRWWHKRRGWPRAGLAWRGEARSRRELW